MHTDPADPHGQNLTEIIAGIGADDGRILISKEKKFFKKFYKIHKKPVKKILV